MGKIVLILGPHGVGKTTLFKYAKEQGDLLTFEGYQIPTTGFDLSKDDDFLKYQHLYSDLIRKDNERIKLSEKSGLVIRSLEESSYYYWLRGSKQLIEAFRNEYDDKSSIKADFIIYLDASRSVLDYRCNGDRDRYMPETINWYATKYHLYKDYWKMYPGVIFLDTENKKTEEIYENIFNIINQ